MSVESELPRPVFREDDGADEREPSLPRRSRGTWLLVAVASATTFAGGLLTGFLVDGSMSSLNEYKDRTGRSCIPTKADPATIVGAQPVAAGSAPLADAAPAQLHSNNDVEWLISVAPGTETQRIEVRNSDQAHGARMEFSTLEDGSISPTASLWIAPSSIANIALPLGRYSVRVQMLDAGQRDSGPIIPVVGGINLTDTETLAVIAGAANGMWRAGGKAGARPVTPPRTTKRRSHPEEEYRGLGESSEDEGSPTYG